MNHAALREEVYRLRYEVYVREFAYEAEEHFAEFMERDDYDDHSVHCLLRHRATGGSSGEEASAQEGALE